MRELGGKTKTSYLTFKKRSEDQAGPSREFNGGQFIEKMKEYSVDFETCVQNAEFTNNLVYDYTDPRDVAVNLCK